MRATRASLVHATAKNLAEHGEKVPAADKAAIEGAVESLKSVLAGDDVEAIKEKTNALAQAAMKLGEAMYKSQEADQAAAQQAGPGAAANKDEKVVDADFEDVTDANKNKKAGSGD